MESISDDVSALVPKPTNVFGAIIFISYIVLALILTTLISKSLYADFIAIPSEQRPRRKAGILLLPSLVSFTTLSWHMSSFLVYSYRDWCKQHNVPLPSTSQLYPLSRDSMIDTIVSIENNLWLWQWASSSTLFRDFAVEIQSGDASRWWTSLALWWELGFAWWMAVQGRNRRINGMWMYFGLVQILPVSFTQSLFFIRLLLQPANQQSNSEDIKRSSPDNPSEARPQRQIHNSTLPADPSSTATVLLPFVYFALLYLPSRALQARNGILFIASIFLLRVILFIPYLVVQRSEEKQENLDMFWTTILALSGSHMFLQTWSLGGISSCFDSLYVALHSGSAVAALGWDVLLAVSTVVLRVVVGAAD